MNVIQGNLQLGADFALVNPNGGLPFPLDSIIMLRDAQPNGVPDAQDIVAGQRFVANQGFVDGQSVRAEGWFVPFGSHRGFWLETMVAIP